MVCRLWNIHVVSQITTTISTTISTTTTIASVKSHNINNSNAIQLVEHNTDCHSCMYMKTKNLNTCNGDKIKRVVLSETDLT